MTVQAFSLSLNSLNWIHTHPRGQRSAAVERAITFFMHHGEVQASRDRLQELVIEYSERVESLEAQLKSLEEQTEAFT